MNFEQRLMEATKYDSRFLPGTIRYSASMRGADPVQNALRISFPEESQTNIGMNTIGTIFHAGMDALVSNGKLLFDKSAMHEHYMSHVVDIDSVACALHGTADLILVGTDPEDRTIRTIEIIDYKLTSSYQMKVLHEKREETAARYLPQLQMLLYLFFSSIHESINADEQDRVHITLSNTFFIRDAMFSRKQRVFEKTNWVEEVFTMKEVHAMLADIRDEIFDEVREMLSVTANDSIKNGCKDRWIRKIDGVTVPTKCVWYCSVKDNCPFYKSEVPPISKRVADPGLWS